MPASDDPGATAGSSALTALSLCLMPLGIVMMSLLYMLKRGLI